METILITGACGFMASYLIAELRRNTEQRVTLHGINRGEKCDIDGVHLHRCDLLNAGELGRLLGSIRPSHVYHLSGTFTDDFATDFAGNVMATQNLLETLRRLKAKTCRVLVVGSAAEYGQAEVEGQAIRESAPVRPVGVYGLTKAFQTQLAQFYARVHGLWVVLVRPFNLIGRGISNRLFIGQLYEQITDLGKGGCEITLGDLSGARDYIDVRDAVRAYQVAIERGVSGEIYNVGSGRLVTIEYVLRLFLDNWKLDRNHVKALSERTRPSDGSTFYADIGKLRKLGWQPQMDIDASVKLFGP